MYVIEACPYPLVDAAPLLSPSSLQSVQHRDRSTILVLPVMSVFPALEHVQTASLSAPWSVAVGVGVQLTQCLMKRLMLVST